MGCVVSNDLSPVFPTLLRAGVWLAALKCCVQQSLASRPRHLSSRLQESPSALDAEDSGKQTLLNYAARSEERPDFC